MTTRFPVNSSVLKSVPYAVVYAEQARQRAFNFVFLDKAMIQMSYEIASGKLLRHRLAFLPSPSLIEFQTNPDLYLHETLYADMVGYQVVSVPIRIDYDVRDGVPNGLQHPAAHLTLGQYQNCRIPVSAPVTPSVFVDFIVRHFYRAPGMKEAKIDLNLEQAFQNAQVLDLQGAVHLFSPGNRSA